MANETMRRRPRPLPFSQIFARDCSKRCLTNGWSQSSDRSDLAQSGVYSGRTRIDEGQMKSELTTPQR